MNISEQEANDITNLTLHYLQSNDFVIATSSIFAMEEDIEFWTQSGDCGGVVVGRTRAGKTKACRFTMRSLKERYGENFPVYLWELTEHIPTDKSFYKSIIDSMSIEGIKKNATGLELRERVIRYFATEALTTPVKRFVLMIDEAHKLHPSEFEWLMDLYNVLLNRYDVLLTCIFIATKEILAVKKNLIASGKHQIVERFLLNVHYFKGIQDYGQMQICLSEMDRVKVITPNDNNQDMVLPEFFFPYGWESKEGLFASKSIEYWEAFREIQMKYNKKDKTIPMEYFMKSVIKYLLKFGRCSSSPDYCLTKEHIKECILQTNYQITEDTAGDISA